MTNTTINAQELLTKAYNKFADGAIAKKYNDADTNPDFSPKKYPENNAIIGNLALHGIKGVNIVVISLSS